MPFEFSFTSEQKLLRKTCRAFFRDEILPTVEHYDKLEKFPEANIKRMAELGFFGIMIPEKYGGVGMGEIEYGIVLEELGQICAAHATILGAHVGLCTLPLTLFGHEDQKTRFLPALARAEKLGAFALTEPQAGSDAASIRVTAVREKDEYVLNGSKMFCSNGDRADVIIVFAATDPSLGPRGGITAFVVEKEFSGFHVAKVEKKMGIRASTTAELSFKDCRVPKENVLGEIGTGFRIALTALDGGRVALAAGALGGAQAALFSIFRLLKLLQKQGALSEHSESLLLLLADTAIELRAARYLTYHALSDIDKYFKTLAAGVRVPTTVRESFSRDSAIAKAFVSEVATRAIERCLEAYGVLGLQEGLGIERDIRDSVISEIYDGTNEIQRLIIASDLLSRDELVS